MGKTVAIVQYGLGRVGRALLRQILVGRETLAARTGLTLRHVALAEIGGQISDPAGLSDEQLQQALEAVDQGTAFGALPGVRQAGGIRDLAVPGPVVQVDVTAADGMEPLALEALARGWGVVLANKRLLSGSLATFRSLTATPRLRAEVTVGAGLPWLEMLRHLLDTGDTVLSLEAAVSGTLGYIFSQLERGVAFSAAVVEARALGYTEPDPRDDLGAADVRRKGLILARLLGMPLEWEDLPAAPLYPAEWDALDIPGFMAALPSLDADYAGRVASARAEGCVLRYAVQIKEGHASVGLCPVGADTPLGRLQGPACMLALTTARYRQHPLVISGPGAGPEVTAAGVYADMISLGMEL
ncbi:MAG: homoserine dehydrogenase [Anaerolineae bacterium]